MPTIEKKKFKKRLFKVSKELNISIDSIREYLDERDYAKAISGKGVNASIVDEDAYLDLMEEYAQDREAAERVKARRAELEAEAQAEAALSGEVAEIEEAAPVPEAPAAPPAEPEPAPEPEPVAEVEVAAEAEAPAATEEVEETPADEPAVLVEEAEAEAPTEPVAEAPEETEQPAAPAEDTAPAEPAEEAAPVDAEAPADASAETEQEPEASEAVASETDEAAEADGEDTSDEEPQVDADGKLLTADRYQLQGTTVVGKIDLSSIDDSSSSRRKRKRKRKKAGSTDQAASTSTTRRDSDTKSRSTAKKKKRGPAVDEADAEQMLQETLRELEQGASRVRQRRRRARREERAAERQAEQDRAIEQERILRVTEYVSTGELAALMNVGVSEIISMLFDAGMMVSINQRLDADTIQIVADEYGYEVDFIRDVTETDLIIEEDDPEDLEPRAPVVTVMGHVDHGKTSLLDYIRRANVVDGEAGGITQHIGAYHVEVGGDKIISFLDTPGHEAFTAMRARGAQATDIVILVVAADDAVMPQTVEAINHARAAEVPVVVAINKLDKPDAKPERVMQQLAEEGVLVEQYGGNVQYSLVSAKTGDGVQDLLDKVILESELLELKANDDRNAVGTVIESRLEKGRGNVATILVQNGTLRVGDNFVAGIHSGRVRAMFDERDNRIDSVGPSRPALILGFNGSPEVGDQFVVLDEEREVRDIAQRRQQIHREQQLRQSRHITLDEIGRRLALGDFQELNLIIKADVSGSIEALSDSLLKLTTEEVAVNIIHSGVGAVNESDVMLASASDAVIIGFQVRPDGGARAAAEREEVEIRNYSIIYNAISDVRDALEGLLSPEESEKITGVVEIRETFKVPKVGTVAGCYVSEGRVTRNDRIRLIRDGVVIYEGDLASLKRFKDDVREVQQGYECGLSINGYNDIKIGDQVESFEIVETRRKLSV
ncbi:MAG: translation initiation factor IF-2 [Bacteroidota bacterium]